MKEKKKISLLTVFIPIFTAIILLLVIPAGKDELRISRIAIVNENDDYFILFNAVNTTDTAIESKLEAIVTYPRGHGKGGFTRDTAGKKKFDIILEPNEQKEIREKIDLILPPKAVFINFRELSPQVLVLSVSKNPV